MTLQLSDLTAWLVQNGYQKIDGRRTKQGGFLYRGCSERCWSISDFAPDARFVSIQPDGEPVPQGGGSTFSDMGLSLQVGSDSTIVGAELHESYSGSALAGAHRAPTSTVEIEQLLEQGRRIFAEFCQAMERSEQSRSNEELRQDISDFLAQNPSALGLWCGAELDDSEQGGDQ